jgi:hypothetical protein
LQPKIYSCASNWSVRRAESQKRWIGSARRECLDFIIPINEEHIRQTLKAWVGHYNRARPHSSLGPGMPDPRLPKAELQA